MNGFVGVLRSLGAGRLGAMIAVSLMMVGFFAWTIMRFQTPAMSPLFTDLALEDSAGVIKELERQGIPYELKRDGATVMIPKDQISRTRMRLAEGGLPRGGNVGYEIFDKSDTLGATSFVQNINHLRALEGELSRSIKTINRIEAARVHLVLPERALFARDKAEPSASIVLRVRGGLDGPQIRAIRHLAASAVQGLKPERVSLVDESGKLLADGATDNKGGPDVGMDERHISLEQRLKDQIETIITSVVGQGRAKVTISAELDYNRITQNSETYDPESKVVRSSQSKDEENSSSQPKDGEVTVGNELPGARRGGAEAPQAKENNRRSEEVVNFDYSKTVRQEIQEVGKIRRINAAVLVDGIYNKSANGDVTYEARTPEELERITALVKSAIGFDAKRGDLVEVVNLRFAETPATPIIENENWMTSLIQFTKEDLMRLIEQGVLFLLGLLVLLFVLRPLLKRVTQAERPMSGQASGDGGGGGGSRAALPVEEEFIMPAPDTTMSKMIDIAQVQGQVHAQSVQKIGDLVEKNPHETTSIIRNWLKEPA